MNCSDTNFLWFSTYSLCLKADLMADTGKADEAFTLLVEEVIPSFSEIEDTYGYALSLNYLAEHFYMIRSNISKVQAFKLFIIANQLRWLTGSPRPHEKDTYLNELENKFTGYTSDKPGLLRNKPKSAEYAAERLLDEADKIIDQKNNSLQVPVLCNT